MGSCVCVCAGVRGLGKASWLVTFELGLVAAGWRGGDRKMGSSLGFFPLPSEMWPPIFHSLPSHT